MKPNLEFMPGQGMCDFCNSAPIYAAYDCEDFEIVAPISNSLGHISKQWAACEECARLIDAEDWKGLLDRACTLFSQTTGIYNECVRKVFSTVQDQFKAHRRRSN